MRAGEDASGSLLSSWVLVNLSRMYRHVGNIDMEETMLRNFFQVTKTTMTTTNMTMIEMMMMMMMMVLVVMLVTIAS